MYNHIGEDGRTEDNTNYLTDPRRSPIKLWEMVSDFLIIIIISLLIEQSPDIFNGNEGESRVPIRLRSTISYIQRFITVYSVKTTYCVEFEVTLSQRNSVFRFSILFLMFFMHVARVYIESCIQ